MYFTAYNCAECTLTYDCIYQNFKTPQTSLIRFSTLTLESTLFYTHYILLNLFR